ncbi:MAG: hypothetical protein KTR32_24045 [Granulosicoccus sp.]|nr:hypothetical protein [Granulosicoccus sp.]
MENSTLVFIIIIEAVIIVWLASKLKQYQKFERLLSPDAAGENSKAKEAKASADQSSDKSEYSTDDMDLAPLLTADSQELAEAAVLDMPGFDPEANIEEAKRVQLVMARCRYAEFYLEQLDDDYERGQFHQIVNSCLNTARNISDPFFRSSALQPIVLLLDKADWQDKRDQVMTEVSDDLVRQRIDAQLGELVS